MRGDARRDGRAHHLIHILAGRRRADPKHGLALDARDSYDEDVDGFAGEAAGLAFAWTCASFACDALLEGFRHEPALELDGLDLGVGRWAFTANATAADGRSDAATVTIELVDDDPPAVAIDAGDVGARVASSAKVVLYGEASPSSLGRAVSPDRRFNTTWRVVAGDLENAEPLSYWARTPYHASAPAGDRDHDLVLAVASRADIRPPVRDVPTTL